MRLGFGNAAVRPCRDPSHSIDDCLACEHPFWWFATVMDHRGDSTARVVGITIAATAAAPIVLALTVARRRRSYAASSRIPSRSATSIIRRCISRSRPRPSSVGADRWPTSRSVCRSSRSSRCRPGSCIFTAQVFDSRAGMYAALALNAPQCSASARGAGCYPTAPSCARRSPPCTASCARTSRPGGGWRRRRDRLALSEYHGVLLMGGIFCTWLSPRVTGWRAPGHTSRR